MPWIALDVQLPAHAKMAALPNDSARYGWIVTLTEAKLQRKPGTFASEQHFRHVLGRHGKFLPAYIAANLIDKEEDGSLQVHGWQQYQWAAAKARQREDSGETSGGHSEDISKTETGLVRASRAVAVPVGVSSLGVGGPGEGDEPEWPLRQWLAQHGCHVNEGNGFHRQLITGVERHSPAAILAMFEKLARGGVEDGDTKGFVFGALDALRPKPDLKRVEAEDRAESERDILNRRFQQTQAYIASMKAPD